MPKRNKIIKYSQRYIKITQNQLQIFDALLYDGGVKKYLDSNNNLRYSEHAGIFDFDKIKLEELYKLNAYRGELSYSLSSFSVDGTMARFDILLQDRNKMPENLIKDFNCSLIFEIVSFLSI